MKNMHKYWASLGGVIGLSILIYLPFTTLQWTDIEPLLWIHFSLLLFHQFEEYAYPGGFNHFFNQNIWNKNRVFRFPLNDAAILWVNIVIAWPAYLLSAINNIKFPWLAIALLLITITNGLLHTFIAIIKKQYNPGLITGFFLFIPFGLFVLLKHSESFTLQDWKSGIGIFIFGTACIPMTIYMSNKINTSTTSD